MQVRVVVQIHPDGQKNVSISSDPTVDIADLIVHAGGWKDAEIITGHVILVGEEGIVRHISDCELRSVDNSTQIEPHREMSNESVTPVQTFLNAHFQKELQDDDSA